jgi:molybdopterin synthase catalytic subunit
VAESSIHIEPEDLLVDHPIPQDRVGEVTARWSADARVGGIVSFAGMVRADHTEAGRVVAIEFTAHESMARTSLSELAGRVAGAYESEVIRIHVQHALGTVSVGQVPLVIVVGASHRPEAFGVCRDLLEALKSEVPIYGKELTEGGGHQWKVNR